MTTETTERLTAVWRGRLTSLAVAWESDVPGADMPLADAVASVVDLHRASGVWAALYALSGRIPSERCVVETMRQAETTGTGAFLDELRDLTTVRSVRRSVEIVAGSVLVDVGHTAQVEFRTGIQRVAVETATRWMRQHDCDLVGWTHDGDALRALDDGEVQTLLAGLPGPGTQKAPSPDAESVLVPLDGIYLSPELTLGRDGFASLVSHSGLSTGVIGFDCVCLTSAETVAPGMAAAFGQYLAGVRDADRVATISHAAAAEYSGWARMLSATGLRGPAVTAVPLADEMDVEPDPELAARYFAAGTAASVLVVGSHEPRKNHLAVLAAAETLWREGLEFSLSFVGGRSWGGGHFEATLERLQGEGRSVATVTGVPDAGLAGGYASARFTVFPSLNEGFGLPVAESLAMGTPVITSNFGSMKEIADAGGGALLVDPRDDDDLTSAMRRLLTDDHLLAELEAQAVARPVRTWDAYAEEVWDVLTGAGESS